MNGSLVRSWPKEANVATNEAKVPDTHRTVPTATEQGTTGWAS
jgi:hypothetical protein